MVKFLPPNCAPLATSRPEFNITTTSHICLIYWFIFHYIGMCPRDFTVMLKNGRIRKKKTAKKETIDKRNKAKTLSGFPNCEQLRRALSVLFENELKRMQNCCLFICMNERKSVLTQELLSSHLPTSPCSYFILVFTQRLNNSSRSKKKQYWIVETILDLVRLPFLLLFLVRRL